MIKEFPSENRVEIVMPRCSFCKQYMIRSGIRAKSGADNNTRRRGDGAVVLDPLTMDASLTMLQMQFRCRKGHEVWNMPVSEVIALNSYSPRNVTIVDGDGKEL